MTAEERTRARVCIDAWRRAQPELERMRYEEIRRADTAGSIAAFDGLFEGAVREFPPKQTSGLVEQQRCFLRASELKEAPEIPVRLEKLRRKVSSQNRS